MEQFSGRMGENGSQLTGNRTLVFQKKVKQGVTFEKAGFNPNYYQTLPSHLLGDNPSPVPIWGSPQHSGNQTSVFQHEVK